MSYNFRNNDYKMAQYLAGALDRIATAMKPTIKGNVNVQRGNYNVVPYQSTHNTGGTMMGADPKTSAVNRYCQAWDVRHGSVAVSAERVLQPDRSRRRARLLVGRGDRHEVAKVKGNRMPYGGLTDGKDVDDIVAYLKTLQ